MSKGLYINFPFCKRFCNYCDFYKEKYDREVVKRYISRLLVELEYYKGDVLDTVYLGGGSPSLLKDEIKILFEFINKNFKFLNPEITVEVNPEDVNKGKIEVWKTCGINRISMGVQTFNRRILNLMGRNYDKEFLIDKYKLLTGSFSNINIDLIFGFPEQNIEFLKKDLEITLSLNPSHISYYLLSWANPLIAKFEYLKPDEDEESEMYNLIKRTLKRAGYVHYEISNFSLDGYECRHNLKYWNMKEWVGVGAGAAGFLNEIWYKNKEDIIKYIEDNVFSREKRRIDYKDRILMGLRTDRGVEANEYLREIFEKKKEFFVFENNRIKMKNKFWFVSNSIISDLITTI